MTDKEALQYFKEMEFIDKWGPDEAGNGDPLIKQADEARLAAIEALEKQIPKKLASDRQCPTCGTDAYANSYDAIKYNFCDNCGQRLDWGE